MSRQIRIAALIWGSSILLSRVIGLVREAAFGRVLGASSEADIYLAAFPFADFLNYLLAAGALSIVFIPMFAGHLARGDHDRAWQSFSVVATFAGALICVASALMWWAAPSFVPFLAPGYAEESGELLVGIVRILVPAQIFHVLGGILSAALQAQNKHALPAMAPLVYTLAVIVGGLISGTAEGFAWGVFVGSVVGPFGLPLLGNIRAGMRFTPMFAPSHPDLRRYLWLSFPIMIGLSIVVVDDWIITAYASEMGEGALASLRYAKNIMRVPMGVFGLAAGVAAFPTISRMIGEGNHDDAFLTLSRAVKITLVLACGAQVALTVAGKEISSVIYGPEIAEETHELIGDALSILCLGLWAWAAHTVVARGFYARGETWLPTLTGTGVAAIFLPLYSILGERCGPLGLTMATTGAISAYVIVLMLILGRRHPGIGDGYGGFASRVVPAAAVAIGAGEALNASVSLPFPLLQGALAGGVATCVYAVALAALRLPEAASLASRFISKLRR